MEQLFELGLFVGKALIIVISIVLVILTISAAASKNKHEAELDIEDINEKYKDYENILQSQLLNKKEKKKLAKEKKKEEKAESDKSKSKLFVLDFKGDIQASQVDQFREEVSAVLSVANSDDEILVKVESPGGVVHGYGLAAAQILRLKDAGLKITIAVDKVAASGGYLMACTGHKIIAAPFAILGSIGVVAQVPNIHRFLKKHDVDYQEITSGEYKRTVSLFGEITEKGKQKFTEQIEDTHKLFKDFVAKERPQLEMDKVATGEYWFAYRAKDLKLVDEIMTSDDFLFGARKNRKIVKVSLQGKKNLAEKLQKLVGSMASRALETKFNLKRFLETGV